jgi:hypothetical protein
LQLVGVEDDAAHTNAQMGPEKLDAIAPNRDAGELRAIRLTTFAIQLRRVVCQHGSTPSPAASLFTIDVAPGGARSGGRNAPPLSPSFDLLALTWLYWPSQKFAQTCRRFKK